MIIAKVKIIESDSNFKLQRQVNEFLQTIDIRQVIKTDYQVSGTQIDSKYSTIIWYVQLEDIREAKLDNILQLK